MCHEAQGREIWRIAIAELTCIGEYSNDSGPWDGDYFAVFGMKNGLWYGAPFCSDGCDETIEVLGTALGCDLNSGLLQSTSFAARIMWPKDLEGQPLLVEKAVNPKLSQLGKSRPL